MSQIKKNSKKQAVSLFTLILCLGAISSWNVGIFQSQEFSSRQPIDAQRSTELGKALPKDKKDGEFDIQLIDPAMSKKWGLSLTDSQTAWKKHKAWGSRDIIVAIIDTGIDTSHPDLKDNLWTNPGESGKDSQGRNKATNGIDDDNNGYIDDVHGWDFVSNNNQLTDNHGHGTHIAGIVGAEGGNGLGISGVSPRVSLMVLKYYDPHAQAMNNLNNTVKAIEYATKMGANIINYSGGGLEKSPQEYQAIKEAQKKGVLFVAAAGNEKSNSDVNGYYPADYDLENIISVTAIDKGKNILPTSNYGVNTVDIAAPGNDIYSTLPNGHFGVMTGTSQATAFVSGVAALIMAKYTDFDAPLIIKHLTQTGDLDEKLAGKTRYKKRLNTYRALAFQDSGVSVNGTVVKNNNNLDPKDFSIDNPEVQQSAARRGQANSLAAMVRSTQKILRKSYSKSRRDDSQTNDKELEASPL